MQSKCESTATETIVTVTGKQKGRVEWRATVTDAGGTTASADCGICVQADTSDLLNLCPTPFTPAAPCVAGKFWVFCSSRRVTRRGMPICYVSLNICQIWMQDQILPFQWVCWEIKNISHSSPLVYLFVCAVQIFFLVDQIKCCLHDTSLSMFWRLRMKVCSCERLFHLASFSSNPEGNMLNYVLKTVTLQFGAQWNSGCSWRWSTCSEELLVTLHLLSFIRIWLHEESFFVVFWILRSIAWKFIETYWKRGSCHGGAAIN